MSYTYDGERGDWYDDDIPAIDLGDIPADWPVKVTDGSGPTDLTCGYCGLSWNDAIPTGMTPTPRARCPFGEFHRY